MICEEVIRALRIRKCRGGSGGKPASFLEEGNIRKAWGSLQRKHSLMRRSSGFLGPYVSSISHSDLLPLKLEKTSAAA